VNFPCLLIFLRVFRVFFLHYIHIPYFSSPSAAVTIAAVACTRSNIDGVRALGSSHPASFLQRRARFASFAEPLRAVPIKNDETSHASLAIEEAGAGPINISLPAEAGPLEMMNEMMNIAVVPTPPITPKVTLEGDTLKVVAARQKLLFVKLALIQ